MSIKKFNDSNDLFRMDIRDYKLHERELMFLQFLVKILEEESSNVQASYNRHICLIEIQKELVKSDSKFSNLECFQFFDEYKRSYFSENMDKLYVDLYSGFEIFLFNTVGALFWLFPELLTDKNEEKVTISLHELQYHKDYLATRKAMIDKKVSDFVYMPIDKMLNKLKTIFGIKLTLSKEELSQLIIISNLRNLIIHNDSKVNDIFISRLTTKNIPIDFLGEEDQVSVLVQTRMKQDRDFLEDLKRKIHKSTENEIKSIIKKIEKLKKIHN